MQIVLPPELEKRIADTVASGEFSSAEEVVREGLRRLFAEGQSDASHLQELRAKIQVGLDAAEREEGMNGEAFFAELDDYIEELTGHRP